jgi:hypothetical protein
LLFISSYLDMNVIKLALYFSEVVKAYGCSKRYLTM